MVFLFLYLQADQSARNAAERAIFMLNNPNGSTYMEIVNKVMTYPLAERVPAWKIKTFLKIGISVHILEHRGADSSRYAVRVPRGKKRKRNRNRKDMPNSAA